MHPFLFILLGRSLVSSLSSAFWHFLCYACKKISFGLGPLNWNTFKHIYIICGDRLWSYDKSEIKSSFPWDANFIHVNKRFACSCVEGHPAGAGTIPFRNHLPAVYTCVFVFLTAECAKGQINRQTCWNAFLSASLSFPAKLCLKSALTRHKKTGRAGSHDHPSPGFNRLIGWILLTSQEEGEALNNPSWNI